MDSEEVIRERVFEGLLDVEGGPEGRSLVYLEAILEVLLDIRQQNAETRALLSDVANGRRGWSVR